MTTTLLIRKDRLQDTRWRTEDDRPLANGQVRVAPDLLALTANNITYAAFGDSMDYWKFFPSNEEGWGVLPVWGFGHVVQSLHPGVAVGERLYGYWPLADGAVLQPDRLDATGLRDAAPHREALHPVYNRYVRTGADPLYRGSDEPFQVLLRPLFTTSWLIDDFLADQDFFGVRRVLLSSASSKTAWATAQLLAKRPGLDVVGFTSPANKAYCERLGCYTRVLAYGQLGEVAADEPCVYVDFAGNADFRKAVHERFRDQLKYSCAVGGTHVQHLGGGAGLPGPRPALFFAPAQLKKRTADWGAEGLQQRLVNSWRAFAAQQDREPWLQVRSHRGRDDVQAAYTQLLAGRVDPSEGHVLTLR
ncbi:DUF2855 family protein [Ramlibacter humi]|uniref:DUF2855 family protein n=1 Tax=Ramlibacter humi TaxID=2530451 RepID=A0A4Z0BWA7_9BURK|nr:DUF2855 family protein [Ramlibacter humi]TFZ03606.1 DUF2855 family protein [Ramlibacter humi]